MGKVVCGIVLVFWASLLRAEEVVIAALGDSLTQGYGLEQPLGFVPQLEAWVTEQGRDVRVINAGVSGDTTAGGLSRIGWTLTPDVDALIVALGGNDLLRGIDPEVTLANLDGIMAAARDADVPVLLIGMEAPGNYGPEYKAAFDAIYPDLSMQYDAIYAESFFLGLEGETPADVIGFMQADGIHPNPAGVLAITEGLGPFVLDLIDRVQ